MKYSLCFSLILATVLISCAPAKKRKIHKAKPKSSRTYTIAKELVKRKSNLNQRYSSRLKKDNNGMPILLWAIQSNDVKAVELLLKNGADPNIKPLKRSTGTILFEVPSSMSLHTKKDESLLHTKANNLKICKLLIKANVNVNYVNSLKETPLMKAALNGRDDICAILIKAGAKINKKNCLDQTAMHLAAQSGYWKVIKLLISKKVKRNTKDRLGKTPLDIAKKRRDEKLHNQCRKALPEAYSNADYTKTISLLSQ